MQGRAETGKQAKTGDASSLFFFDVIETIELQAVAANATARNEGASLVLYSGSLCSDVVC